MNAEQRMNMELLQHTESSQYYVSLPFYIHLYFMHFTLNYTCVKLHCLHISCHNPVIHNRIWSQSSLPW